MAKIDVDRFLLPYWDSDTLIELDRKLDLSQSFDTNKQANVFINKLLGLSSNEWFFDKEWFDEFIGADGSINIEALEKTLTEIKINSFFYLYNAQLDAVNYQRFDLRISDLNQMDRIGGKESHFPRKYVGFLDGNFIDEGKRLTFRRSPFFNKELSIFDVASNPHIFSHVFMVFIDGKFYDNLNIYCDEDKTYLIVTIKEGSQTVGLPLDYFEQLVAQDSKITVYFVPNCSYGVYTTNINVLNKYKDNLALSRFNLANNLESENKYITFINSNDFLFSSVITDTTNSSDMLRFFDNALNDFNSKYVHLNIFGFRNLLDQIDLRGDQKFFSIPRQDMPIPVENMMIFRNVNGKKYFAHDVKVKLYYPNYYEILNNDMNDDLTIYVFYFKDKKTTGFQQYTNDLEKYQEVFNLTAEDYANNLVSELVRNYMPEVFRYDFKDYWDSDYEPNHVIYKIKKFLEWIELNPELLRQYIKNRLTEADGNGYYIDCSKIDLNSRYRVNNHQEIFDGNKRETFDGSYYVFILRNEFFDDEMHYRFFVDGLLHVPKYIYTDDKFVYVYFPTSLIRPDSIIEIEKFYTFEFRTNARFTTLYERVPVTIPPKKGAIASDIFIIETDTKKFVDKTKYEIVIPTDIKLPLGSAKDLPTQFEIEVIDDSLLNIDLTIYVKKYFYFERFDIETEEDRMMPFIFDSKSNNDASYIRGFKNGRFIPLNLIHTQFSDTIDGENFVFPQLERQIGDVFVLDYTPYRYTEVYRQDTIDPYGFVDLRGKIDKPFDLKWYDIYLNGRKLFSRNIEIITPTIIRIKNVYSTKNLIIVQKNRDPEYFGLDENSKTIMDIIWDTDPSFRDRLQAGTDPINDIEPDIISGVVSAITYELWLFYKNVVSIKKFINPDLYQITDEEKAQYPLIFNGGNVAFLNPNLTGADADTKLKIFPSVN